MAFEELFVFAHLSWATDPPAEPGLTPKSIFDLFILLF
jgi:hypothetical protein